MLKKNSLLALAVFLTLVPCVPLSAKAGDKEPVEPSAADIFRSSDPTATFGLDDEGFQCLTESVIIGRRHSTVNRRDFLMRHLVFLPILGLALGCNDSRFVAPRDGLTMAAAVPAQKILFQDNFDDGDTQGWDLRGDGWSVETENTNYVLSSSTAGEFAFARVQDPGWYDFRFNSRVKFISGDVYCELLFRIDELGQHYWLQITPNSIALHKEGAGAFEELERQEMTILQNIWYDFDISAKDKKFKVYVNGAPKINVKDDDPWGNVGTIGFEIHNNTHVHFDDVVVSRLGSKD